MRAGPGIAGLCGSAAQLDASLSTIEFMAKPTEEQKGAFNALREAAKLYTTVMTRACADYPRAVPERISASEKRLDAALSGLRNLRPAMEKFYAALNDQQKSEVDLLLTLPAL
jgi:hypothetical protein